MNFVNVSNEVNRWVMKVTASHFSCRSCLNSFPVSTQSYSNSKVVSVVKSKLCMLIWVYLSSILQGSIAAKH